MARLSLTFCTLLPGTPMTLPMVASGIAAGFPKPSDDYAEESIDINDLLIDQPAATFLMRVDGDSMKEAGIFTGDYVVVNRAAEWTNGSIVVARIADEYTLKRIHKRHGRMWLLAANPAFAAIELTADCDCEVWGCVTSSFRRY